MGCRSSKMISYASVPYIPNVSSPDDSNASSESQETFLGDVTVKKTTTATLTASDMTLALAQFEQIKARIKEWVKQNGSASLEYCTMEQQKHFMFDIILLGEQPWTPARANAIERLYEKYYNYERITKSY